MTGSFLEAPPASPQVQALYGEDLAGSGYVWPAAATCGTCPGCGRTGQRPSGGCPG